MQLSLSGPVADALTAKPTRASTIVSTEAIRKTFTGAEKRIGEAIIGAEKAGAGTAKGNRPLVGSINPTCREAL
jgi:hypothetical protein